VRIQSAEPGLTLGVDAGRSADLLLELTDVGASDPQVAGMKAANLSQAARGGLPVLPGFVITTAATSARDPIAALDHMLHAAWDELSHGGGKRLVVRSSSTVEDAGTSSMAGQFTSVLDVRTWDQFADAVTAVLVSALRPRDEVTRAKPMAVLVQPQLDVELGGVLFGIDPVSGDDKRLIVEASREGPDAVVSGRVRSTHLVLTRRGRLVGRPPKDVRRALSDHRRRQLAHLAQATAKVFGGPQDIEWAFDVEGHLWLLQARPVTAVGSSAAGGALFGPGPVAETFPDALHPLEAELWAEPLREGIIAALAATGAVSRHRVASSPVLVVIGGRVAVDLELLGVMPGRRSVWSRLSVTRPTRRLAAAWRVGRLRAGMARLSDQVLREADASLAEVPNLTRLSDADLMSLLSRACAHLAALHGHEVLAGMLLTGASASGDRQTTAAALALAARRQAWNAGLRGRDITSRWPVVLALVPPSIGVRPADEEPPSLDPEAGPSSAPASVGSPSLADLGTREAMRLRCRWVQELTALAAMELGRRLCDRGLLGDALLIREMTLPELRDAVCAGVIPPDLPSRAATPAGPPLASTFRLGPSERPVPVVDRHGPRHEGSPSGGGRGIGVVRHVGSPGTAEGAVLVVNTLDPRLASELPKLAGLVSETGSSLSHLCILAREMGVPTVVGVPGACERFADGQQLLVDGDTGEVHLVTADREPR
jgi:pyruvate,water dikinase